ADRIDTVAKQTPKFAGVIGTTWKPASDADDGNRFIASALELGQLELQALELNERLLHQLGVRTARGGLTLVHCLLVMPPVFVPIDRPTHPLEGCRARRPSHAARQTRHRPRLQRSKRSRARELRRPDSP